VTAMAPMFELRARGPDPRRPLVLGPVVALAAVVVVVQAVWAVLGQSYVRFSAGGGAVWLVLAVVYLGLALLWPWGSRLGVAVYFAIQTPLVVLLLVSTFGFASLTGMVVVSQAVLAMPRPAVAAYVLLHAGVVWVASGPVAPSPSVHLAWALNHGAACLFVWAFTEVAVRERVARVEVERLSREVQELAAERERNRLAREIHDGVGHYLTVVHVQIEAARTLLDAEPARALESLRKAGRLTHEALTELRRSVAALKGPREPLGQALAKLVEDARAGGSDAALSVAGEPRNLSPGVELALYRVAQEGLTNVRKHAPGARGAVTLDYRAEGEVRVSVEDDGAGPAEPAKSNGGFGLVGLRERLGLLGGELVVEAVPGKGFRVEGRIPA